MVFSAFERMVAMRYLCARRQEGFISVIAGFSLLGIALGVATLIIVMSVMNGFRAELVGRILGLNGHLAIVGTRAARITRESAWSCSMYSRNALASPSIASIAVRSPPAQNARPCPAITIAPIAASAAAD